ncbi:MAG: uncharacterized protein KVP18_000202 [Porospora cf. gigantea A]|uniref:uncharacterized protein n=1 Tax=Porospora cf. gigantea A TaxID=2853593 RepID=UPI00355A0701|nr:MAG: hypothetical protein KVP18_000202 [Porospora cf. gigantea A]
MLNSPLLGATEAELPGTVELEASSIGCPREPEGDDRVAVTPESVRTLVSRGFRVLIEVHAGERAGFSDEQYIRSGGKMVDKITVWAADVVLKLKAPASEEASLVSLGQTVVCLGPDLDPGVLEICCTRRVNLFLLSRIPLLQKYLQYDAMSSMQNLAGYKAVLFAAHHFGRLLGGQCTPAGRVPPAIVVVLGCGVAGLAALAAARGMGAAVTCIASNLDNREQVHALGGLHLELTADSLQSQIAISDVVIVTGEYDGDPLTSQMCKLLRFGSVIVDLTGRLTELSRKDTSYTTPGGVTVIGHSDMAALIPQQASKLYSSNITRFLLALESRRRPGQLAIDRCEDLARYTLVVLAGVVLPPPPKVPTPKKRQLEPTVQQDTSFSVALAVTAGCGVLMLINLVVSRDVVLHLLVVLVLASAVAFQAANACSAVLYGPFMGLLCAFSGVSGMATASLLSTSLTASWPLVGATVACESVSAVGLLLTQDWVSCFSSGRATRYLYIIPGVLIPSLYLVARLIFHDNVDFMTQVAGSLCCAGSVMSLSSVSEAEFATPLAAVGLIAGFACALTTASHHGMALRFLSRV